MTGSVGFISSSHMETSIVQLNAWLVTQSINVPSGWVEACLDWLVSEHGGLEACSHLTEEDWRTLIYEQWLHSDMRQLSCPVLPTMPTHPGVINTRVGPPATSKTMKLEGELCLQVEGLFNVGDSYYSQLRQHEGNISVNLPYLDNLEADLGADPDHTHMTQAVSQTMLSSTHMPGTQSPGTYRSLSLYLTDGVSQIKAIELGTMGTGRSINRAPLSFADLSERLRPGVKVRLRGPLLLRNNVLLLPAGALQTLSNPQLQVLGGEVDELLESRDGDLMYQLGLLLAKKMNLTLSEDGSLPSWFPRITAIVRPSEATNSPQSNGTGIPNEVVDHGQMETTASHLPPPRTTNSPAMEPWDDETLDDALLNEAAQTLEQNLAQEPCVSGSERLPSSFSNGFNAHTTTSRLPIPNNVDESDLSLENEVDPDVFAEALNELDDGMVGIGPSPSWTTFPRDNDVNQTSAPPTTSVKPPSSGGVISVEAKPSPSTTKIEPSTVKQSSCKESDDLLPPAPKRKPWERKLLTASHKSNSGPTATSSSAATTTTGPQEPIHSTNTTSQPQQSSFKFHPFCYIEDMYNELIQVDLNSALPPRRVYTIRGILISLLSSLEHHQGTRWTLSARLADGSATVDVDISSDLLTEWIGLTASESESLRQMSRNVASETGSSRSTVALQEAQKHRHRLRTALSNFQTRLSNLAGLFDLTPPPLASVTSLGKSNTNTQTSDEEKPLRPILVAYRELDRTWLRELHERVSSRGYVPKLPA